MARVVIGALLTVAGVVTLFIPEFPFICIGALIFGPVMLFTGLSDNRGVRRYRPVRPISQSTSGPPWASLKVCSSCAQNNYPSARFCVYCGALLP